ncbi:hypothetical protein Tco_1052349 [Tanacetum coccineum]
MGFTSFHPFYIPGFDLLLSLVPMKTFSITILNAPGTIFHSGAFPTAGMASTVRRISQICTSWSGFGYTWRVGIIESLMDAPPSMAQAVKHVSVIASFATSYPGEPLMEEISRASYPAFDVLRSFLDVFMFTFAEVLDVSTLGSQSGSFLVL